MVRLIFIASILLWVVAGCSNETPTGTTPVKPSARGAASFQTADSPSSDTALFDCTQVQEARVRFSDPGFLDHLEVGLYVLYVGVPSGEKRLRIWWDYANSFDRYQEIRIDEADLERISGQHVYGRVIEHRYDPVSAPTPKQVRAELVIMGRPGGCGRNRDIVVQPLGPVVEELGDPNPPCGGKACTVFVTSTRHDGAFGGLAGGDAICRDRAAAAGISGDFKAWLSDDGASPATRFTQAGTPYVLPEGTVVAGNWSALTSGFIQHHIDVTELKTEADGFKTVWTRTLSNGSSASFALGPDCGGWTRSDPTEFGTNGQYEGGLVLWSFIGASSCNAQLRLYCFQQ